MFPWFLALFTLINSLHLIKEHKLLAHPVHKNVEYSYTSD